jgi:diguanylate cyclase (GGDEF)-like protein
MILVFEKIKHLWSITGFNSQSLTVFAQQHLVSEIQQGLKLMSGLLFILALSAMLFFKAENPLQAYSLNYFWVLALAVHINISTRMVTEIKTLHLLGMTLLVISATAYVFIAHQTGSFSPLLLANIVFLFMIIPMIPWGLREAGTVILAIYLLLTLSSLSVKGRFDDESIRILQFFLLATGLTSLVLVIRATMTRKNELVAHFDLKKAHEDLYSLSNMDPLTGAWNRRYLQSALNNLVQNFQASLNQFYFAIFDLDKFKQLNDDFGHEFGDRVLQITSSIVKAELENKGYLIRIGGDEFVILMVHQNPVDIIEKCCLAIKTELKTQNSAAIFAMSYGIVSAPLQMTCDLEALYQQADKALYVNKQANRNLDRRLSDSQIALNKTKLI